MNKEIRKTEEEITLLYAKKFVFSEHLTKYEDDKLKNKYDHNYFAYSDDFTKEEFEKALSYQLDKGADFLKFIGRISLNEKYGMEEGVVLTMLLENNDTSLWKSNSRLEFKKPDKEELKKHELKEYGNIYGEEFTLANIDRLYDKQDYVAAYPNGQLAGSCITYVNDEYVAIDNMLVDENMRNQYVCTSLLKKIVDENSDKKIYLHADEDDTPRYLYERLGFRIADRGYEYHLLNIKK